jgi:hypothetical protein
MEEEEKFIKPINILLVFLIGITGILILIASTGTFNLEKYEIIKLSVIIIIIYLIILLSLLKTRTRKIKEIPIIKREIIREIEKPIIQKITEKIETPVIKKIFIKKQEPEKIKPRKRYNYIGSRLTETYHKSSCRMARLIKPKYKVKENNKKYFKLRDYKPCKICKP